MVIWELCGGCVGVLVWQCESWMGVLGYVVLERLMLHTLKMEYRTGVAETKKEMSKRS